MAPPNFIISTCGQSNDTCPDVQTVYTRWRSGVKQFSYDGSNVWEDGTDPLPPAWEAARGASYRPNLSHYLRAKYTGLELGICTSGVSGTSLFGVWAVAASAEYIAFRTRTLAAAAAANLTLSASNFIVYFIGMESDVIAGRTAVQIKADIDTMVAQMRADFGVPTLKVFFTAPYDSARIAASAVVKTGIDNAVAGDANVYLMVDFNGVDHDDTVHISKEGNDAWGTAGAAYVDTVFDFSAFSKPIPASRSYISAQYNNSPYYFTVDIDSSVIPSNQTFFPIVMGEAHLPPRFWGGMYSSGGTDVVFTDTNGTKFDVEKVAVDKTAKTLTIWMKTAEILSARDSRFLIQFGSSEVNETSRLNTWKGCYNGVDYLRVLHCEEAAGNLTCSVSGFAVVPANGAYGATMEVNNGITNNGNNTVWDLGLLTELSNIQNFSFLYWMRQNTVDRDDYMFSMTPGGVNGIWNYTSAAGTGVMYFSIWDGALGRLAVNYVDEGITSGQLFQLAAVFDGTLAAANRAKMYYNATLQPSTPTTVPAQTPTFAAGNAFLGRNVLSLDGDLDEFRILLGSLTQDQVTVHNYNESQFSTNNIFSFGDVSRFGGPSPRQGSVSMALSLGVS